MLDEIDKSLLNLLENNARISFADLAVQVGLSKTPCWNRIKDMQKRGIIKGYYTALDESSLGLDIVALVHVVVKFNHASDFEKGIRDHKQVLSCYAVTGDYDYVLKVIASSMSNLDDLLRKELSSIVGVARFSSTIVTRHIKQKTQIADLL